MPKASRGSKNPSKNGTAREPITRPVSHPSPQASGALATTARGSQAGRRVAPTRVVGSQSLVFPAMVALGCWGMAFTLAYFYADPNRFLFAGMAALMGLFWTYNVYARYTRMRKMRKT